MNAIENILPILLAGSVSFACITAGIYFLMLALGKRQI